MQMDKREKLKPRGKSNLIMCNKEWGPVFGDGDLYISDRCNVNRDSGGFFPNTYNTKEKTYKKSQKSWKYFSGA